MDRAVAVAADISREQGAERLVAATMSAFGLLDLLVNNAGLRIRSSTRAAPVTSIWQSRFVVSRPHPAPLTFCRRIH
jgi:NAD(P)-dependent dehydrogenase (short-subunit alcohol dehydrogenase family)